MIDVVCIMFVVFFISPALKQNCLIWCAPCKCLCQHLLFSFKLLLSDNTFFMELLRTTGSGRYPPEKLFRKFFKKSPENFEVWIKSFFLMMLQTLYLKFYKNAIFTSMFSYKFWQFFRTMFPLKTFPDYLWMGSIYSVKMYLQNTSKALPKICDVTNVI